MSGTEPSSTPSKCAVCDTYSMKGMWMCVCDAMNVSRNEHCWKCGEARTEGLANAGR